MSHSPNMGIADVTFHDKVTAIGSGLEYSIVSGASVMNLQFITSFAFTAKIEVQLIDTNTWYPYPSFKMPTMNLMSGDITDRASIYQVDLTGIKKIRINLTSVGGEISVYGRVVS